VVNKENPNIIPYSPKKIKMKFRLEYSTLKPLISSLSPSAKSKGARLHSVIQEIHHKRKRKREGFKKKKVDLNEIFCHSNKGERRIKANLIS